MASPHLRVEDHTYDDLSNKFVDEDDGVNLPRGTTCVKEINWSEFTSDSNPGGGNGSYSDFFTQLDDSTAVMTRASNSIDYRALNKVVDGNHTTSLQYSSRSTNDNHDHYCVSETVGGQYWENLYPGWSYDPNTGQWYQLDSYHVRDQQISYNNNNDSAHMVFDPQYPGWFYDTITQEWKPLESYNDAVMNGQTSFHSQQQNHNDVRDYSDWNDEQAWKTSSLPQTGHHFIHTMELDRQNGFIPANGFSNHFENCKNDSRKEMQFSNGNFQQTEFNQGISHFPCISNEEKMSIRHLPHALATFGFGGKLIVMKNNSPPNSINGGQVSKAPIAKALIEDSAGGVIKILNLMDIFRDKNDLSFPGPLVGGNVGSKEVNRWIDEKISSNSQIPYMGNRKGSLLSLLFSLLKIACHYYGKLRSPLGTDFTLMKETDCAESAVAKLFASSSKRNGCYANSGLCLQNVPSERKRQAVAHEVQKCLVYGRMREALQLAQGGQLWGPAIVLAAQLGNQSYNDTVKQMALQQLVAGSPLRTLWLLIAGQPADIFSSTAHTSIVHDSVKISHHPAEIGAICMLDVWEENIAIIAANRTKDDELVITHLGDCLWKERGEVTAAHICYLVAETNFDSYSDSTRLCLVGADHWTFPRTFASLEAIQITEIFEYSKVLGNPQFILTPFQPYKIIYAYMLAEMGKIGDSLKYCQAISKCLRTTRVPEAESWKSLLLSLEQRIKIYQQGGYSVNLGPVKLMGKLLNLFDTTAQRVVGLPPPVPHSPQGGAKHVKHDHPPSKGGEGNGVSCSQSAMAMSSLVPSASVEPVCDWGGNNLKPRHNRSISEPDFGKSPRKFVQVGFTHHRTPQKQEKSSALSGGFARFGRFGSQIFQKTVGMVLRSRTDRQAKLGDKNKFHYDSKLKRWVEEGADVQLTETTLPPPPPKIAAFPDKTSQQQQPQSGDSPKKKTHNQTAITNSNNLSGGGHIGIRSRYVDTFNKGGGVRSENEFEFQGPGPGAKRNGSGGVPKFFVPGQVQQPISTAAAALLSPSMQRLLSFDDIARKKGGDGIILSNQNGHGSSPQSRRTVSWSGCFPDLSEEDGSGVVLPVPTISQEQQALQNRERSAICSPSA
ncbi:protein transport protein SEC16B homolog [Impatiens glandulifera]|uniref:protein transport protein SEC16B homolog n=1 Tax=Impatiens glandulifera TaxID=253017 RepID=UPI001FB0BDD5|nr:protein transport protein SEC16B homolog [Impatiens glandulifera]